MSAIDPARLREAMRQEVPRLITDTPQREQAWVELSQAAIAAAEKELDGNGRVVVRYSGTEALARVMVEAESEKKMNALTEGIAGAIKKNLG